MSSLVDGLIGSSIVALVFLVLAAVAFRLLRTQVEEHLRQSVRHGFDLDLEEFRDDLSRLSAQLNSVQTAGNAALVEGQRASAEWRMKAVDELWREVVRIRSEAPVAIGFQDILLRSELSEPKALQDLSDLVQENMAEPILRGTGVERVRPFVGEPLYLQCFIYRAVTGRVGYLLEKGLKAGNLTPWYEDDGIHQLLGHVLTMDEIRQFKQLDISQLHWVQNAIEAKILDGMQRLIAGEISSQESVAQAQKILVQVQSIQGTNGRHAPVR